MRVDPVEDANLADLIAKRVLRPPLQRTATPPARYVVNVPLKTLLDELDSDRADRPSVRER